MTIWVNMTIWVSVTIWVSLTIWVSVTVTPIVYYELGQYLVFYSIVEIAENAFPILI